MKNWSKLGVTLTLVLTLVFVIVPGKAYAQVYQQTLLPPPTSQEVASGSWTWTSGVGGSEVQQGKLTTPGPVWRLIITRGLVLSGPAYICHEFTGNQFGWKGDIYMLNGDSWTKLATTIEWTPTPEGHLMACAQAPAAGTYALFAYWEELEGWQPTKRTIPLK